MKFIVAQIGARRRYAVPSLLEDAGMLERFYTDCSGDLGLGRILAQLKGIPVMGNAASRLAGRTLPPNIRRKTITFPSRTIVHSLRQALLRRDAADSFRSALRFSNALGDAMVRCGFGNATHLYSMLGECGPLLVSAKERGLQVVSEVYIPLSTERIVAQERQSFPGWEIDVPDHESIRREFPTASVLLSHSDFALSSSKTVRDDLVANFGFPLERTAIVPYGVKQDWLLVQNRPVRGRILFPGTAELRKGIHYFALAAEQLMARGFRYEFRVAGNVRASVAQQPACRSLAFLGRISPEAMAREFATADICVLPSLAEASAGATYEAIAVGVPLVTTPETDAVIRDQIEGRIVPSRDVNALAEAMAEIIEDREKRDRMAAAAKQRAKEFTWAQYRERLLFALRQFA